MCFHSAYKIARAMVVAKSRMEEGALDVTEISKHMDSLAKSVAAMSGFIAQARTIKNNGEKIEEGLAELQEAMEERINEVLAMIDKQPCGPNGAN